MASERVLIHPNNITCQQIARNKKNGGTNLNVSGISIIAMIAMLFGIQKKTERSHYFHLFTLPHLTLIFSALIMAADSSCCCCSRRSARRWVSKGPTCGPQRNRHAGTLLGRLQISGLLNQFLHVRTIAPMYSILQKKSWFTT